jgi:hypothetical protein
LFHDLDEVVASPMADRKLPWWVKEADKPTVEIDWSTMKRFDARNTIFNPQAFAKAVGQEQNARLLEVGGFIGERAHGDKVRENKPGHTLRDLALNMGGRFYMQPFANQTDPPFLGPRKAPTPEHLGVPRWKGTPEENTRMVRAAARFFGAATLGVVELDESTRKLFYSHDALDGKAVEFEDTDEPLETDKKRVIPYKAGWAIVYTIRMSPAAMATSPFPVSQAAVFMGYAEGGLVANRLQEFLRTLGYHCMAETNLMGSLANSGGFGVISCACSRLLPIYLWLPRNRYVPVCFVSVTLARNALKLVQVIVLVWKRNPRGRRRDSGTTPALTHTMSIHPGASHTGRRREGRVPFAWPYAHSPIYPNEISHLCTKQ